MVTAAIEIKRCLLLGRKAMTNLWKSEKSLSRVQLFVTPWTGAYQAPPSMEFSKQEYWSGLPFPSPGDLPVPGIEPSSPALQALLLYRLSHQGSIMTNLDSILKGRDITLPTKVCLVKAMVFPIVMYGCERWTKGKLSAEILMLLNCGVGEDSWESLGLQGDLTSPS